MNIEKFLESLNNNGTYLWKSGDSLHYRSTKGNITEDELKQIKSLKQEIMNYLDSIENKVVHDEGTRYEEFSMTDVQSAYKLGRGGEFEYGGVGCHVYMEVEYDKLDVSKAQRIWNQLIRRHDMLRCVFLENGQQKILEKTEEFQINFHDFSSAPEKLAQLREELGHKKYELNKFPLYDIEVSRLEDKTIMHISMELILADWVSISILLDEFDRLYKNEINTLDSLDITFRDYQLLQEKMKNTSKYKEDEKYWFDRLESIPGAPELPLDIMEDAEPHFKRFQLNMPANEWDTMKELSKKKGFTPTAIVLSVFSQIIGYWSSNSSYCINLTLLNRQEIHEQVKNLVGDFTSVSLLEVKKNQDFHEFAKQIQKQLMEDLEHRLCSGVEVIREISRQKGQASSLMPIVFTSAIGFNSMENGHLSNLGKYGISQTPQVFIDCQVMDSDTGLTVNWDVREGIFPEGLVEDMFAAFSKMMKDVSEGKSVQKAEEYLPSYQIEERIKANSIKGIIPDKQLHNYVFENLQDKEENIAVIDAFEEITYKQLYQRTKTIMKKLVTSEVKPNDYVAVVMEKTAYQVAAVLAVLGVGAAYVPIDPEQPLLRQQSILNQIGAKVILTNSNEEIELKEECDTIEVDELEPFMGNLPFYEGSLSDSAYVIFTSGSTGVPKGVEITHKAAANTILNLNKRFGIGEKDKVLSLAKLNFDLSVYDLFGLLIAGGTIVFTEEESKLSPSHWAQLIQKHKITVWNSVPAMLQMLHFYLNSDTNADISCMRIFMLSGDWIPVTMPEVIKKYCKEALILCMGGATEASIWSNCYVYQEKNEKIKSIPYGKPLENQAYYVLNEELKDCPVYVKGQLFIAGEGLAKCYYGNEEETKKHFIIHPSKQIRMYATGDMGRYLPGGDIEFLGREDSQIKIKGHRIEMGDIEASLCRHPDVSSAAVTVYNAGSEKLLFAFAELDQEEEQTHFEIMMEEKSLTANETQLKDYLSMNLPSYMVPFRIQIMEQLPLSTNGKVDRNKLADMCKELMIQPSEDVERASVEIDELAKVLIEIWTQVLGVNEFGINDDYYKLGADSLSIAQVASKLRDYLEENDDYKNVPYNDIFNTMLHESNTEAVVTFIQNYEEGQSVENIKKKKIGQIVRYGGGKKGPLRVVFHAGVGTMSGLRSFIDKLEKQEIGPVIGVIVSDFDTYYNTDPYELIGMLADDYTELICGCHAEEIQLIGYCMGGIIAVEVARRLKLRNENLIDLVLVESQPMTYKVQDELVMEALFQKLLDINMQMVGFGKATDDEIINCMTEVIEQYHGEIPKGAMSKLHGDELHENVGDIFRKMEEYTAQDRLAIYIKEAERVAGKKISADMVKSLFFNFKQSVQACYIEPMPYMGNIRFLEADEKIMYIPWANNGAQIWKEVCMGTYTLEHIAGDHYTCIKKKEYLDRLVYLVSQPLLERGQDNED